LQDLIYDVKSRTEVCIITPDDKQKILLSHVQKLVNLTDSLIPSLKMVLQYFCHLPVLNESKTILELIYSHNNNIKV
jgi:hypothetical protein